MMVIGQVNAQTVGLFGGQALPVVGKGGFLGLGQQRAGRDGLSRERQIV